jgi:hypothetical protein
VFVSVEWLTRSRGSRSESESEQGE